MPTVRKGFEAGFNRKRADQAAEREAEAAAQGYPQLPPPPPPALPRATGKTTRPDLYPAFAAGVASAGTARVVPSSDEYVGGTNSSDVNKHPLDKVATSGADTRTPGSASKRELLAERPRKRRTPSGY